MSITTMSCAAFGVVSVAIMSSKKVTIDDAQSSSLHVVTLGFVRRSFASHERSSGSRCAKCMLEIIWLFLSNNCSFSDSDSCVAVPTENHDLYAGPVPSPGELVQLA